MTNRPTKKAACSKTWDERFCPHQYYRHADGSTDCPACAREAAEAAK